MLEEVLLRLLEHLQIAIVLFYLHSVLVFFFFLELIEHLNVVGVIDLI
jgi:hypothetical protein